MTKNHVFVFLAVVSFLGFSADVEAKRRNYQERLDDRGSAVTYLPPCLDRSRDPIQGDNNQQVLRWKEQTPNQFKDRALVDGVLVGTILDRASHLHLEIDLTPDTNDARDRRDHIEIVYNKSFGEVNKTTPGMRVQACGDYITATEQSGNYKPSPVGAIVHWVHKSNSPGKHADGFLAIDGTIFGLEDEKDRGFRGMTEFFLLPAAAF